MIHSSSTIYCLEQKCFSGFLELDPTIILCREKLSFWKSWLVFTMISVKEIQRYTEVTHDPLLFSVAQGIIWLSTERLSRSTLHLKEGEMGVCTHLHCSLAATVTSCIDVSVRIETTSPKVGPLLIFSFSLSVSRRLFFAAQQRIAVT